MFLPFISTRIGPCPDTYGLLETSSGSRLNPLVSTTYRLCRPIDLCLGDSLDTVGFRYGDGPFLRILLFWGLAVTNSVGHGFVAAISVKKNVSPTVFKISCSLFTFFNQFSQSFSSCSVALTVAVILLFSVAFSTIINASLGSSPISINSISDTSLDCMAGACTVATSAAGVMPLPLFSSLVDAVSK